MVMDMAAKKKSREERMEAKRAAIRAEQGEMEGQDVVETEDQPESLPEDSKPEAADQEEVSNKS
jgi:hypothetical protein